MIKFEIFEELAHCEDIECIASIINAVDEDVRPAFIVNHLIADALTWSGYDSIIYDYNVEEAMYSLRGEGVEFDELVICDLLKYTCVKHNIDLIAD